MNEPRTLAIDIGGTGIKAALLDEAGKMIGERQRVPTPPKPVAPDELLRAIDQVVSPLGPFERVSVGFPGYVRDGRLVTAPNLGTDALAGFDLQSVLADHLGKPVRVLNDADVQGFGAVRGQGLEMVLTLGTGAGTAMFRDGEVMPHLELSHHPVSGNKTYDEYAKDITLPLPTDVTIVPNTDGLTGGIGLWRKDPAAYAAANVPSGEGNAGISAEPDQPSDTNA